ncbi:MAG: class I SAM-dependent methyltransferase [Coleofasciculus sp. A1-SPW-01]|uniref:class I SAM-dependent methyltransferase n=1 Tax=Coleofasciculus sp. A1-SPW-01 TaxID=3070819 RepID=UPI0033039B86
MKILIAIANYGTKNDKYLHQVLEQYHLLPYQKTIIVHTNVTKDLGDDVKVEVGLPTPDPRSLVWSHRRLFVENADRYDLYIYTEDDTPLLPDNLDYYLKVNKYLPDNYVPGFLRYELGSSGRVSFPDIMGSYHWYPDSVKSFDSYTFAELSNKHSALYVLTRSQLQTAIHSGNYALLPHRSRYDIMASAASDLFHNCGLTKVICISHIDKFLLHHLSNKYVERFGLSKEDLEAQVKALMEVKSGSLSKSSLFNTETKLLKGYNKHYYSKCEQIVNSVSAKSKKVLSVGCGIGKTEAALVERGHQVVAIPLDEVVAVPARSRGIATVESDFEKALASLSKQRFDCIVFEDVLAHLHDPTIILTRFVNLLNDQGQIMATFLNTKYDKFTDESFEPLDQTLKGVYDFETLGLHLTSEQMVRSWFHQSGLKVQSVAYYNFLNRQRRIYNGLSFGWLAKKWAKRFLIVAVRQRK